MKSPLRYPGGKTRATKTLYSLIQYHIQQNNITDICSPFLGGGSFELFLCTTGINVTGYDIFDPLVDFWQCMLTDPDKLVAVIETYKKSYDSGIPTAKEQFYILQKTQHEYSDVWHRAAIFFTLNRSSFSGSTMSGGWSPDYPRFNDSSIERVKSFNEPLLQVNKLSFDQSITKHKNSFLYLDPPYMIEHNLYGKKGNTHKDFDHLGLYDILTTRDNWIMSYNDDADIRNLYQNYKIETVNWAYGMTSNRKSNEIVIFSDDIISDPYSIDAISKGANIIW